MKEYDIFLPLEYNDGAPVELDKFEAVKRRRERVVSPLAALLS